MIKARVSVPRSLVRLFFQPAATNDTKRLALDAAADADGVATFALRGLAPATRYSYRLEVAGSPSLYGALRTFGNGPSNARIAFASCAETGSRSPVFDAIRVADPDLFVHMGDLHYEDISGNDPSRFRRAYEAVLGSPIQAALYRNVPIAYMWDDHDFGANNSDASSPSRPAALEVYRQFVPHYPIDVDGADGIQQAFQIGRVRVILTDSRSRRHPPTRASRGSVLGPRQLEWLKGQLTAAADAPLVVWVNTVPWIAGRGAGGDTWAAYGAEREEIATEIDRLGLTRRLVMLSGDAHMVAIDDGTHSNYAPSRQGRAPGFVVMHAAPLDRATSVKGGPYSHGVVRHRNQFGLMDVADDGQVLRVELTGRDVEGHVLPGMRLALRCADGACVQAPD